MLEYRQKQKKKEENTMLNNEKFVNLETVEREREREREQLFI